MFKIITSLTLSLLGLLAKAQNQSSLDAFHRLNVNNNVTVVYTRGKDYRFDFQSTPATANGLITRVQNGTLFISQIENIPVTVTVIAPAIDDIQAAQHAVIIANSVIEVPDFSLALASGARFNGTVKATNSTRLRGKSGGIFNILLETDKFTGDFAGGAKVNLSGKAVSGTIATHGNTVCLARNFKLEKAGIEATGLSEVHLSVSQSIHVAASDDAVVTYFGTPAMTVDPNAIATISE